jgi:DNA-binding CsgD family transcriptional regulator/PAS domain-containing protein
MEPADHLLPLIQELYAAPGTVEGWHSFLESLRIALHGSAASLLSEDLQSQQCSFTATTLANPEVTLLYDKQWGATDPWAHSPKSAHLSRRRVIVGEELIAHRDVQQTAYYQDFARHYDIVRAFIGVLETTSTALSVISISGSERRQPFCERDVALLEPLVPHIQRALQLHRRLVAIDAAAADLASVVDNLSRAVFLVDAKGRITFTNRAASRLTAMRDGLMVEHGELRAAGAAATTRLRSLLADAVSVSNGSGLGTGGMLTVGRPSGRRALAVLVCPVSRQPTLFPMSESAAAIVFVNDPEQITVPDEETLRALYGLTPAEAKLTRLLAEGHSLMEASARLDLRRETVRSRLKTIFEKTSTHRQAELVRLVLNGIPRTAPAKSAMAISANHRMSPVP